MKQFSADKMKSILTQHHRWWDSAGVAGEPANLDRADLRELDLRGKDLRGVNFGQAKLQGTSLQETDLTEADLSCVEGLQAWQLGGANVSGAELPRDIQEFAVLDYASKTAKHVRGVFFTLIIVCVYCWLIIITTTDADLLTNFSESPLPIIDTNVPIVNFYWAVPLLLLALYLYLHIYLLRLWKAVAELPAVFPDGVPLPRHLSPSLLSNLIWKNFSRLRHQKPPLIELQSILVVGLFWWLTPLTLVAFWLRYLRIHEWLITSFHIVFLIMALSAGMRFSLLTTEILNLGKRTSLWQLRLPSLGKLLLGGWFGYTIYAVILLIEGGEEVNNYLLCSMALYAGMGIAGLSADRFTAFKEKTKNYVLMGVIITSIAASYVDSDFSLATMISGMAGMSFLTFYPPCREVYVKKQLITFCFCFTFAFVISLGVNQGVKIEKLFPPPLGKELDLYEKRIKNKRDIANWIILSVSMIDKHTPPPLKKTYQPVDPRIIVPRLMTWLHFQSFVNLRHAEVCLKPPQWTGKTPEEVAAVRQAALGGWNLKYADGYNAFLVRADLDGTNLEGADLRHANLMLANLFFGNLIYADLRKAELQGAILSMANLTRASLMEARMQKANLQLANLTEADLYQAQLSEADLTLASLKDTWLEGVDMRKVKGLSRKQIMEARCWPLNAYSPDLLTELRLTPDHNDRLSKKDLQSYQFKGINLKQASLEGFNLRATNLEGANLQGANLQGANLQGAVLAKANLKGARLLQSHGLTMEQLQEAYLDEKTKLQPHLKNLIP